MTPQRLIDSHHHIWRKADVPWLADEPKPRIFGPYEAIRRDYPVQEFIADHGRFKVEKSVYVQCNWHPARAVDETAWVQSVADASGFPHGIVAYVDLAAADAVQQIARHAVHPNLRGVRQQIHWHRNPHWAYVTRPDLYLDAAWQRGLAAVAEQGLSFDLQVFPSQLEGVSEVLARFPTMPFVLNHAGMPEDRSAEGWKLWRDGMRALSKQPNAYVKFSGLNTFEHRCSADLMRPIVQESLDAFGARRCMFGSNFPIEKLWTSYETYVADLIEAIGAVPQGDLDQIFHDTAARVYRL